MNQNIYFLSIQLTLLNDKHQRENTERQTHTDSIF